jgi:DNA-binding MarR family transcriptional regulator
MEKDGLVKKTREVPKSALLKFELTEKGSNIEKRCNIKTSDKTIMSVLSEEERQQLISMMNKLRNKAIKYKGS